MRMAMMQNMMGMNMQNNPAMRQQMSSMMANPQFQATMQQMMADPSFMERAEAANPMLQQAFAANPGARDQLRQMMQNPAVMQVMCDGGVCVVVVCGRGGGRGKCTLGCQWWVIHGSSHVHLTCNY